MANLHIYFDQESEGEIVQIAQGLSDETPRKPDPEKRLLYPRVDGWHDKDRGEVVYRVVEALLSDVEEDGNEANTTEQTVLSVTVPADKLIAEGRGLDWMAWGFTADNSDTKTIRAKGNSTLLMVNDVTLKPRNLSWVMKGRIYRKAVVDTQTCISEGIFGAAAQSVQRVASTFPEASAITISITVQSATATANNIVGQGLAVRLC